MKKLKQFTAAFALVGLLLVAVAATAHADVNDFTVTDFAADYSLSKADRQGQLHIIEHISVDFTDQNHGILRAIPDSYKNHPLKVQVNAVTSDSNAPASYSTYKSNGNTVLKIGDANRTVTGVQEYNLDYTLSNVIGFYKDHDELYWNINGTEWSQPFQHVAVTVHLLDGLMSTSQKPLCYTGGYGSNSQSCTIAQAGNSLQAETSSALQPNQTLTIVTGFHKGYFQPTTWYDTLADYWKPIAAVLALPIVVGAIAWWYWLKRGRDARGHGVIIPQYGPPEGLSPLEVGTLIDFKADNRDITAIIIDLAVRHYIKITETKQKHLLKKDGLSYTL